MTASPYRSAPLQTRHRLVYEIGDAGVARLSEAEIELSLPGEAGEWAEDYLLRAGLSVTRREERAAESSTLGHAVAALRGALEAVEVIKSTLGVGERASVEAAIREATRRE